MFSVSLYVFVFLYLSLLMLAVYGLQLLTKWIHGVVTSVAGDEGAIVADGITGDLPYENSRNPILYPALIII
jgi:hypothetical protein